MENPFNVNLPITHPADFFDNVFGKDQRSFIGYLQDEIKSKAWNGFNKKLEEHLKDNLAVHGFIFTTRDEFLSFISKRVMRIAFEDEPYHFQYFLDYKSEEDKGFLIGDTNEETHFEYDQNKITVTIGKMIS